MLAPCTIVHLCISEKMGFVSAALGTLYVCVSIYLGYNVN